MDYIEQHKYLLELYESYFESCEEGSVVLSFEEWLDSIS